MKDIFAVGVNLHVSIIHFKSLITLSYHWGQTHNLLAVRQNP